LKNKTEKQIHLGLHIVVVDNGFVYVGDCFWDGDFLRIEQAENIRRWGTTKGLGELINGPLKDTQHDPAGTVLVPKYRVTLFLHCHKWL